VLVVNAPSVDKPLYTYLRMSYLLGHTYVLYVHM